MANISLMGARPGEDDARFTVLGPVTVTHHETEVPLGPPKPRVVLAVLLLHANETVSAGLLAEAVWDGTPPATVRTALQNHVMRLRRALGPELGGRLATRPLGYRLEVRDGELDLTRFARLHESGRAAARDGAWADAARHLDAAMDQWTGEPLSDLSRSALLTAELRRLTELRLQAMELRMEASLRLGRHRDVIGELQRLASIYPLHERFREQLMLALYRDGRQTEALAAYLDIRRTLVDELGVEPADGLQRLQQAILAADPALAAAELTPPAGDRSTAATGREKTPVPRQLPATVPYFTGRSEELAALSARLDQTGSVALVISAIGGTAGVGKTALAVSWAHQVAGQFPDGQLYVNLRGYDPGQPLTAADALAGFLRALGVPGQDIAPEADERAARYRSLLAGRRMLVILDNARSAEQVRPLLPGAPGCAVVITSRDALTGLVVRDGAVRLSLDLLPSADAVGLLRELIGARAVAEPAAAEALATRCCRLPLALRVAAELAAARPGIPLADLVEELADQQHRLDMLDVTEDPRSSVRAVFSWSCRHLDDGAARAFRLLGLDPGPDCDPYAAAALTGATVDEARELLDRLTRAHLVAASGASRFGMHDLLRGYARDLTEAPERQQALTRLLDYYLHAAAVAMHAVYPAEDRLRPSIVAAAAPVPPVTEPAAALAWLDEQRPSLVAAAAQAAEGGWPGHAVRLATTLYRYLVAGGHYPETVAVYTSARHAARRLGDLAAEAFALASLGEVDWRQGRCLRAASLMEQAIALSRDAGDRTGEARALGNLGLVELVLGRVQQAADHLRDAVAAFRETGDQAGVARTLSNLGVAERRQGRDRAAAELFGQALALCREVGDRPGEAWSLARLGRLAAGDGHGPQALRQLEQAVAVFREVGDRAGEAYALTNLAVAEAQQGRYQQATEHHELALALYRETGERAGEAEALNGLGEILRATGRIAEAQARHATALTLAEQVGDTYEQAHAYNGLAHASAAAGRPAAAREHWQRALALYTSIAAPEAREVQARLTFSAKQPG